MCHVFCVLTDVKTPLLYQRRKIMRLGTNELIIILVIVLLIVGPTQIPKLAKLFGKASKKFKEGMNNEEDGDKTQES